MTIPESMSNKVKPSKTVDRIATSDADRLRVMAGPGTGKTTALMSRVTRLLTDGVKPEGILVVTFTRVAAADLVRAISEIGVKGCDRIKAGTLHSFCMATLRRQGVFEATGRVPRPLLTFTNHNVLQFEAQPMLADLRTNPKFGTNTECSERIAAFEADWARLQSEKPGWPSDKVDREFHMALKDWLTWHEAMLIGELIPETLHFLRDNPAAKGVTQFEHIIVDEYQDLNRAEQELIELLARDNKLSIVGDPDQSIYSFKFAHPEGIVEYSTSHPGTSDEQLTQCRRCPSQVVEMANSLILHNTQGRFGGSLQSVPGKASGEVHIVQWETLEAEATGVALYLAHLVKNRGLSPGDILVLAPKKAIAEPIRAQVASAGIKTLSLFQDDTLNSAAAQEAICLLTLLSNGSDKVALRFWLGLGSPTWRAKEYSTLLSHSKRTGNNLNECLFELKNGNTKIKGVDGILRQLDKLYARLETLAKLEGKELVDQLFPDSEKWAKSVRALLSFDDSDESSPQDLLDKLRTSMTRPEVATGVEAVRFMSLYKSKGLTSKAVVVVGCLEGLIPKLDRNLPKHEQTSTLEEQRRLFYVALTRCQSIVLISSAATIDTQLTQRWGIPVRSKPKKSAKAISSSFIGELGPSAPSTIAGNQFLEHMGLI